VYYPSLLVEIMDPVSDLKDYMAGKVLAKVSEFDDLVK
jgi:hypothetical protein